MPVETSARALGNARLAAGARVLLVGVVVVMLTIAGAARTPVARADGDPGSDVLVFQNLFVGSAAGLSVAQQLQLGGLLQSASRAGFPIRVAIIAGRDDLGAVTELWLAPRAYARFLGIELSDAYAQRLLVVMPDGFGFNWPGHSATAAYRVLANVTLHPGLFSAAESAVRRLAAADGVALPAGGGGSGGANAGAPGGATSGGGANAGATGGGVRGSDRTGASAMPGGSGDGALIVAVALAVLCSLGGGVLVARRRRRPRGGRGDAGASGLIWSSAARVRSAGQASWRGIPRPAVLGLAVLVLLAAAEALLVIVSASPSSSSADALASNAYLDPGTSLLRPAPEFTLDDQFGQRVSLHAMRGKVVILAFNDSECTTVCPLTTTAMLDAKQMLGAAGASVGLVGVDANPAATSIEDLWSYSELHGMLHQWQFLTGSLKQLTRVWTAYGIEAQVQRGEVAHTPALFVIDPNGQIRKLYMTQQSYASVGQLGQLLAQEVASLLPGRPRVNASLSYAQVPAIAPSATVALPRVGGGTVRLGAGTARLFLFFATWDQEVTSIGGQLDALSAYQSSARAAGLPALTAVDEGTVEPTAGALPRFLHGLSHPLSYPVAIDQSGRVADGYEVQGLPWFVLVSPAGQIVWYWQVSTSGWLARAALIREVRAALARAPKAPASAAAAALQLAGSPAPLAALHQQAGAVLGDQRALAARIRSLRGYPIVINAWASGCPACLSEFGLVASAAARDGRQVAFLGADTDDSAGDARTFLAQHPVSYPSYQATTTKLSSLAVIEGLPTTIFINRAGKVVYVHSGQYVSQGTLDADIATYALDG
ncbi:MAG: redoxin domain-containing protein [Solirubrobacteraceae bacterium]